MMCHIKNILWGIRCFLYRWSFCLCGRHENITMCGFGEVTDMLTGDVIHKIDNPWETRCVHCGAVDEQETQKWNTQQEAGSGHPERQNT